MMSISALHPTGMGPFSQATSNFGKGSLRGQGVESLSGSDTVSATALPKIEEIDEAGVLSNIQGLLGNQRADALSAHGGLDMSRIMKLLE